MKKSILLAMLSAVSALDAAVKVTVDSIRQNWPWSKEVIVGFTLSGVEDEAVDIETEAFAGGKLLGKLLPFGECMHLTENKSYVLKVNPDVAVANALVADFKVKLTPVASDPSWDVPLYRIYDLTEEDAEVEIVTPAEILSGAHGDYHWSGSLPVFEPGKPLSYTNLVWTGVNQDDYKNKYLAMRYLPASGQKVNICCNEKSAYLMPENYYIGVFETTQKQWNQIMGEFPECEHSGEKNNRPVETMSYAEVRGHSEDNYWPLPPAKDSFLGKLRAKTGDTPFDLPTAYQLTYAAQAGNNFCVAASKFESATYPDNKPTATIEDGVVVVNAASARYKSSTTASVGSFAPSSQGIYDIIGNVSEMCVDWDFETQASQRELGALANVDPGNPAGPRTPGGSRENRHYTGSNYSIKSEDQHALNIARGAVTPETGSKLIGFRLFLPACGDEAGERAELIDAVAGESAACSVIVKPDETAFWRTVTNSTFEVSWLFPAGTQKAKLSVAGMGAEYVYDNLTENSKKLVLPSPVTAEDVYKLTLLFDDDSEQNCLLGVVRGAQEGGTALVDYASDSNIAWRRTKTKAVFPIPFGAETIMVDGQGYSLDGAAGWFGYVYPAGAEVSEVALDAGAVEYENSLIPFRGFILTIR